MREEIEADFAANGVGDDLDELEAGGKTWFAGGKSEKNTKKRYDANVYLDRARAEGLFRRRGSSEMKSVISSRRLLKKQQQHQKLLGSPAWKVGKRVEKAAAEKAEQEREGLLPPLMFLMKPGSGSFSSSRGRAGLELQEFQELRKNYRSYRKGAKVRKEEMGMIKGMNGVMPGLFRRRKRAISR